MANRYDIFQIKNNNIVPQRGNVLISEPFLDDRYFGRSVVLLIEHDEESGSMGIVLNKLLNKPMNDFFPELKSLPVIPLFQGGPVGVNRLFFIHTLGEIVEGSTLIDDGLYFGGDFDTIKSYLMEGNSSEGRIKFFLGYAGWSKNQLEEEILYNSWLVSKADKSRMLSFEGELCWKKTLQAMGNKYKSWANFPKRPFMN